MFGLFEDDNDFDAEDYLQQIEPMLRDIYNPYIQHGMTAYPGLQEQYNLLMTNPAAVQSMLGQSYQQSPGYQFSYDQAMNAANQANAAGGMLGTSAHQQQAMGAATGLASQDYNNYLNNQMQLYGMGLQGNQGFYNTGYNASNQLAGGLGNAYGSAAQLSYANKANQDQMLASLLGAGIGAAGYALGGPMGGALATGITKGGGSTDWVDQSMNDLFRF